MFFHDSAEVTLGHTGHHKVDKLVLLEILSQLNHSMFVDVAEPKLRIKLEHG